MSTATAEFVDLIGRAQKQTIAGLKEMQSVSLRAAQGNIDKLPSPTEVVEASFGFAEELLRLQKNFALEVAGLAAGSKTPASS